MPRCLAPGALAAACLACLLWPACGKPGRGLHSLSQAPRRFDVSEGVRKAWLRCSRGEEIDWPRLRDKFESYADKYVDAPQLFRAEAQLAYGHAFTPLLLPASAPCPLGDLSLRLFMWLFVSGEDLLSAVRSLPQYAAQPGSDEPGGILADAIWQIFAIPLPWSDLLHTGWPIFSVISQIWQRARAELAASGHTEAADSHCENVAIWGGPRYLDALEQSFRGGQLLPLHASVSALLGMDREACPLAFASVLLAMADSARWDATDAGLGAAGGRNAAYYRYAAVAPMGTDGLMLDDLRRMTGRAYADDQQALVSLAEDLVRSMGDPGRYAGAEPWPTAALLTQWPVWRLLDRLSCGEWVQVRSLPQEPTGHTRRLRSASRSFYLHVFPHRVSSDGLQSSVTRASRRAYCAKEFQNELDNLRLRYPPATGARLRVVEAGPHLGDCLLWAAARVGCAGRLKATGYDVIHQLVALIRKSIVRNAAEACLDAKLGMLTEHSVKVSGYAGVGVMHLDAEVSEFVHLMKVHTNGGEDAILRGARRVFSEFGVGVVVVNSASAAVLVRCAEFLSSYGGPSYLLELRGEPLAGSRQTISEALHKAVQDFGSMQLVARRSDLPPIPEAGTNLTHLLL